MAGRYAAALFELASEAGAIDAVGADLKRFAGLIAESSDLERLVKSPVFSADEQLAGLSAVLNRVGIGGLAGQFLRLTAANRRLFAVPDMMRAYHALVAKSRGEETAHVVTAEPLDANHVDALKSALKAATGKDVGLTIDVDPSLIGGLTVQVGSRMVDASLKTKLQSIKIAMKEVG
jgi:F-type H+-transporting ATPase subunit delta